MSRSGYSDDLDPLDLGRWRAQVASAMRGARGQRFFRDLVAALDALPEKKLARSAIERRDEGTVCALGALGRHRGVAIADLDTYDHEDLGKVFDIAHQLAQETMYENDERYDQSDEARWQRMRAWAAAHLRERS